jgi:hypothetical protein
MTAVDASTEHFVGVVVAYVITPFPRREVVVGVSVKPVLKVM